MTPSSFPAAGYRRPELTDSTGLVVTVAGLDNDPERRYDFAVASVSSLVSIEVATAFADCVSPDGVWHTAASMRTGYNAALAFLRSLTRLNITVTTLADFSPEHWWTWRADREQVNRWPGQINLARVLLRRVPVLNPLTLRAINQRTHKPRKRLYDAYSPSEFARIRGAAARDVTAAEIRISRNLRLLQPDPRTTTDVSSVSPAATARSAQSLLLELQQVGRLNLGTCSAQERAARILGTGSLHPTYALYPTRGEVISMMVLLACDRGYNLSTLESMSVPDIAGQDEADQEVLVEHLDKPRRGSRRHFTNSFSGEHSRTLRRIATSTGPARRCLEGLGHATNRLFISGTSSGVTGHPTRLFVTGEFTKGTSMRQWERERGIAADDGSALHVTFPRIRLTEQVVNRRSSQNTDAVSEDVYRRPDASTAALVEDVILGAQADAIAHATATVRMRYARTVQELDLSPRVAQDVTAGRLNTATGACTDYEHSPFGIAGSACTVSFLLCLACPNAITTPAHLPRLVALRDCFANFATAHPSRFLKLYTPHSQRLEHLLSTIRPADLRAAEAAVTDDDRSTIDRLMRREFDA